MLHTRGPQGNQCHSKTHQRGWRRHPGLAGVWRAPPQAGRNGTWHGPPETAGGVRPGVAQGNRGTWPRGHLSGASAAAAAAQPTRELPGTDRRLSRPPAGRLREDDAERKDPEERRTSAQNARRRKLIYSDKKTRAAGSGGEAEGQRQGWVRGARRATSPQRLRTRHPSRRGASVAPG